MDLDNHPIPQDVSHFQFKLIGEMTLKQFGYLGAGFVMAWLFFSLPINFFVRIPLALIYAGSGIVLAFVPIEGRPADTMIKNFAKALFAPNQYIFHKESADAVLSNLLGSVPVTTQSSTPPPQPPSIQQPDQPGMDLYIPTQPQGQQSTPAHQPEPIYTPAPREYVQVQKAPSAQPAAPEEKPKTVVTPQPIQLPTPPAPEKQENPSEGPTEQRVSQEQQNLSQQANSLTQALEQAKSEEQGQQGSPGYEQAHQKVIELEGQLQQFAQQKQQLEQELLVLKQKLANQTTGPVYTPSIAAPEQPAPAPQQSQHVRQVSKQMGTSIGMPHVPDVPNLITGIVKDSRGNVLPNILIEVKDVEGNPVRAFKTNQLGQFASATPLLNGIYTIFFEDPSSKHRFDTIEITANGDILLPIEVISIDQREELRKELFG